jgi:hypothetical protein
LRACVYVFFTLGVSHRMLELAVVVVPLFQ